MSLKTEHCIEIYRDISAIPSATSVNILPGINENICCIHSNWNSEDLTKLEKNSFFRDYIFDKEKLSVLFAGKPCDSNSVCREFSKSGRKQAIIREKKSIKNSSTSNYDIEIWSDSKKEKTFELSDQDDEKINTNAFACRSWSADETFLLYTAEAEKPKSSSYFKVVRENENKKETEEKNKKETRGEEYIYQEEWGEDFVGSHHSVAVILNIKTGTRKVISAENISIGQAIWGPNDSCIVFVGYEEFPRRLGIRSCTNRSSAIFVYDCLTECIDSISEIGGISVRNPRFSPDFKTLIYLENKIGGPHFKASKLQKCDWTTKKISTVVDLVDSPKNDEFPGLYVYSIPSKCWFGNNLFLSSQWRSYISILCINIDSGTFQRIESKVLSHPDGLEETFGSCNVLSVQENLIVAEFSSPNIEPCLVLGVINLKGGKTAINWKFLDSEAPVKHTDIDWKVVEMNSDNAELFYEIILVTPSISKKDVSSVIMRPHGGPHSSYCASFYKGVLAFTKLNYINCLVNYRGSDGYGEHNLNSLPGKVGENDVSDLQQAAEWIKSLPDFTIKNSFLVGGSHGGFLSAHLIGQYPDFYKAAVLLNPVVDISGMTETSDIPDWCWVEGGCGDVFDSSCVISPENLKMMWERSPIQYIDKVKTPVLLLLGNKDLRVPFAQGLKYYHILRARKVPAKVHTYEDNHSLSKTPHSADVFMQTVLWLEKYSS